MVNGNDVLEFEEENCERLTEAFIEKHRDLWDAFVLEEFNNNFYEE